MNEKQAAELAGRIGGEAWHSGGNHWLVLVDGPNGSVRVLDEFLENTYASRKAFHRGDDPTKVRSLDEPK